jgi:predicted ribosomally synthesized peptide with nif11-like leader
MGLNAEIERFCRDIETMEALREELKKVGTDQPAIVQLANSKGYAFTLADVESLAAEAELTDAQLESAAGGATGAGGAGSSSFFEIMPTRLGAVGGVFFGGGSSAMSSYIGPRPR